MFQSLQSQSLIPSVAEQLSSLNSMLPTLKRCTLKVDPSLYPDIVSMLPRYGERNNAWESLITITDMPKTVELLKLANSWQFRLASPKQCIVCHKLLSSIPATKVHYQTHTKEKPYSCKICGWATTTKSNMKSYLCTHKAAPLHTRLFQCSVCRKRFTNNWTLQAHYRLHQFTHNAPVKIRTAIEPNDKFIHNMNSNMFSDGPPTIMTTNFSVELPMGEKGIERIAGTDNSHTGLATNEDALDFGN